MQTIGFLLPRSTYYTGISFDLFDGLTSSLSSLGRNDIRIVTENIGFGSDKQLCYKAAEQLIMHEQAQVVFAYIGHRMAQVLRPLFTAANRLLIVLDAGAHLPQEWPSSPHIYYHSLNNALGSWLSSNLAVRDGYSNGGMVTGYYDGGYLHTVGAYNGYLEAGGKMRFNLATGYRKEDFSMQPLKEQFQHSETDCLISLFSGDYVQWFFKDLVQHFPDQHLPVYLPPFALEESMLKEAVYPGDKVSGIATWSVNLQNEQNALFTDKIRAAGREPNLFSLLGWEAGILADFLTKELQQRPNCKQAAEQLSDFSFESPRGTVVFDKETNSSIAPLYEAKIENDGTGHCAVKIVGEIADVASAYENLRSQPIEESVSGWFNSYTCI